MSSRRSRRLLACAAFALLSGCGSSTAPVSAPEAPAPTPAPGAGAPLSSYLHDLSPKLDGVTADSATLEHYAIPVSDGTVLDGWVRRPPGEFGQPLVIVFSPYYGGGDPALSVLGDPSSSFAQYLVPYGYAVGFISVGGTGNSGGCFRDGGPIERRQLYDAAEFMAHQTWSNGRLAAIGVSYDGTTANELFVEPPPSIKTVVPMEGISDFYRYTFNIGGIPRADNTFFTTYYYPIVGLSPAGLEGGVGPTEPAGWMTELQGEPCPEQLAIQQESVTTEVSADKTPYWDERDAIALVRDSLDRPRPPMFFIEGFQDANVDPQMADGWLEAVAQTGVPLHVWFGQWVHAYPQSGDCAALAPCRGDFWEQALLAWFDQFLLGRNTGILDAPAVQLQADDGTWRHAQHWPPSTLALSLFPQADGTLGLVAGDGTASYLDTGSNHYSDGNTGEVVPFPQVPGSSLDFAGAPLPATLRLTGLPRLQFGATASGQRANLVATLLERKADGTQRYLNFGALNLNHAGSIAAGAADITGVPLAATFNFYPQDNVVAAGSRLVLHLAGDIETTHTSSGDAANFLNYGMNVLPVAAGATVTLDLAQTRLELPVNPDQRAEATPWVPVPP
jgi:predicted acyl esterase